MQTMQAPSDGLNYAILASLHFTPSALYLPHATFTPSNAPTSNSPLQTRFDSACLTNTNSSVDSYTNSAASSSFDSWGEEVGKDSLARKRRHHNATTQAEDASAIAPRRKMGRRPKDGNAEPGSERAIYLEKNRKAASKCRNKQKVQQDELVETARNFERKNKALKLEVQLLEADMRCLMEIVGTHRACSDQRLQTYVQHEADRLAASDKHSRVARLLLPKDGTGSERA
jgi:cyclic AMP-dependent transcription factor ATF-2